MTPVPPFPDPIELQSELGLPAEQLWDHYVQYSTGAQCVVLSLVVSRDRIPHSRIYVRHIEEERYRLAVNLPTDDYSVDGPVLSDAPAYLFYILSRWIRSGSDFDSQYIGVGRLNLRTGADEVWETDVPGTSRLFVAELAGTSPDGNVLYAVCGFPSKDGPVDYAVAELDWTRRLVAKKTSLRGPFF
jgi:hypothetical protein